MRAVLGLLLLSAVASVRGAPYSSPDMKLPSPGPDWRMQSSVPEAPLLRGSFVLDHGATGFSQITFALERDPDPADPLPYLENSFKMLSAPPLSFKVAKKGADTFKGMPGATAVYTDKDGKRHYTERVARTPAGQMLVLVLQTPDAETFASDLPAFEKCAEGVTLIAPKTGKKK